MQVEKKEKEKKRQILAKGRQPVSSSSPASAPHQKVRGPPQGSGANLATALAPKTQSRRSFKRAKKPQWLLSLYVTVFIYFVSGVATREEVSKHRDARGLRTRSAVPPQLWGPARLAGPCDIVGANEDTVVPGVCIRVCVGRRKHTPPSHSGSFN